MKKNEQLSQIYTIGHSIHSIEAFLALLARHNIDVVADVRSVPYSRWQPQYNREAIRSALREHNIRYGFFGAELGARSDDRNCYEGGRVRYDRLAATALFQSGINRLRRGISDHRIALMCAEKEPLECHRTILVGRRLEEEGVRVIHILADGRTEAHSEAMKRLATGLGLPEHDLFMSSAELKDRAYEMQEEKIAFAAESAQTSI